MELKRYFDRAIGASLRDLALRDDPAAPYLADLCSRFVRTEALFPRGVTAPRLETVVDMLLEVQAAWREGTPAWQPEREVAVRRHIGDYTLFMTGVFRERVDRVASAGYYISQGKRAYQFVSEYDRAAARDGAPLYRRLADRFESYVRVLDYARRVHFTEAPDHPFFRFGLG